MKEDVTENSEIRNYLLGKSSPEEASRVEMRLLSERDFYEEVSIVEEELIDQYLAGALPEPDRESFESHFLASAKRQWKVRFARALKKYVSVNEEGHDQDSFVAKSGRIARKLFVFWWRNPIVSYTIVATAVLVFAFASWALVVRLQDRSINRPARLVSAVLTPGLDREGGQINRISFLPETDRLQLDLVLEGDTYRSYRAVVLRDDGSEAWTAEDLKIKNKGGRKIIVADIPAENITTGDYQIKVSGKLPNDKYEAVSGYRFSVAK